eukprot:475195-Pyramimonas_sp.AAC.1
MVQEVHSMVHEVHSMVQREVNAVVQAVNSAVYKRRIQRCTRGELSGTRCACWRRRAAVGDVRDAVPGVRRGGDHDVQPVLLGAAGAAAHGPQEHLREAQRPGGDGHGAGPGPHRPRAQ